MYEVPGPKASEADGSSQDVVGPTGGISSFGNKTVDALQGWAQVLRKSALSCHARREMRYYFTLVSVTLYLQKQIGVEDEALSAHDCRACQCSSGSFFSHQIAPVGSGRFAQMLWSRAHIVDFVVPPPTKTAIARVRCVITTDKPSRKQRLRSAVPHNSCDLTFINLAFPPHGSISDRQQFPGIW